MDWAKAFRYMINPAQAVVELINGDEPAIYKDDSLGERVLDTVLPIPDVYDVVNDTSSGLNAAGNAIDEGLDNAGEWLTTGEGGKAISDLWDDITGKSTIDLQNRYEEERAEKQYQRDIQSIGDSLKAQLEAYGENGLNRNLMYSQAGGSVGYSAPQLTAYTGANRIDKIMQGVGKILGILPAMYQATAALEAIDQAREKTKQSQIKTMSDGMSMLLKGYNLSDTALSKPFSNHFSPSMFGGKRKIENFFNLSDWKPYSLKFYSDKGQYIGDGGFQDYADAALKHQLELLNSVGITNSLNRTRNDYLGYQRDLDRRFGAAGRIVGMASQGLGALGNVGKNIFNIPEFFKKKYLGY